MVLISIGLCSSERLPQWSAHMILPCAAAAAVRVSTHGCFKRTAAAAGLLSLRKEGPT